MHRRILLIAGWLFPVVVLLLFVIKGQFYNPAVFAPPASEVTALPVPVSLGSWVLEDGIFLPADRMFEEIDGKADYYLQYGATDLSSGEWTANGQGWDMYLYHFKGEQGARGSYNGEKPADGRPIEGVEGYTLPGQVALTVGNYYLQLNALTAGADTTPAVDLAMALVPHLSNADEGGEETKQVDLIALAGTDAEGDAEGFIPESAFGFSSFNNVRTVDVALNDTDAVWFTTEGDAATVAAYAEELATYGGENLFTDGNASGGSMFGSWGIAGVLNNAVWGVQNAPSRDALMQHWNALQERLKKESEGS